MIERLMLPEFVPGSVWLVGAGPGDPGLLSVLALHALESADAVVYDALVDPRILALARHDAEMDYAGKRGGRRVLRLKGGDPMVFGRGGEEALALAEAGVPFRIVPGITAGIGGLAYAGIPLTHRTINSVVTLVTGHPSDTSAEALPDTRDWAAIARGAPVLVLYLGLKHLGTIAARLIAAGRDPAEPVAIISKATTAGQRVLISTLASAAAEAAAQAIEPPAIVVVGAVVRLGPVLDWFAPGEGGG
ncbi:MAG: uroporphyrinogen-III C-methyltransferase [Stellaceae bacterium]